MGDSWDELAADWENTDTRLYAARAFDSWVQKIAPLMSNLSESRGLDFGCGTGLLTEKLASLCGHIVAVDPSKGMIEVLQGKVADREIDNITPLVTGIDRAAIKQHAELSGDFDFIVASSVCSFLPDYASTLRDLTSLLKPVGLFAQWDWMTDMPIQRIRRVFEASGLTCLGAEQAFEMTSKSESMPVVLGYARRS